MKKVVANKTTDIFDKAGGTKVGDMFVNDDATATGKTDGAFTEIDFGDGTPAVWVRTADLDFEEPEPKPFELNKFVKDCIFVDRMINLLPTTAPFFISADFLIARALIETGLQPAGERVPRSGAVGPMQISSDQWKTFLDNADSSLTKDYLPRDFDEPLAQIRAAGYRMFADAGAYCKIKEQKGTDPSDKGFLPTYLDLFHSYLLDGADAVFAIADAQGSAAGNAKTMKELLDGILKQEEVDRLFLERATYLGTAGASKTVGQFVDETEAKLTAALKQAFDLIRQHAPEELPTEPANPTIMVVPVDPGNVARLPATGPVDFATLKAPANETFWPVITDDHQALVVSYQDTADKIIGANGRKFFADRRNGARHHVGLDVFCKDGDVVVACAKGRIVNFYSFYKSGIGEDTFALFIEHDGVVVNYGEVKGDAPAKFNWRVGDEVEAGQQIAHVSSTNMIHFETYLPGTTQNSRWLAGGAKPPSLRNPTLLLLNLAANATRIGIDGRRSVGSGGSGRIAGGAGESVSIDLKDLQTLARTIYGEAGSETEPPAAREGVAHVVMNRLQRRLLGDDTVFKVCRHDKEFSCWNADAPNLPRIISMVAGADPVFDECSEIAEGVMKGLLPDNTGGATHYYSETAARPDWANPPARQTVKIGTRLFFTDVNVANRGSTVITPRPGPAGGSSGARYQPSSPEAARILGGIIELANRANPVEFAFRGVKFLAMLEGGQLMFDSELQLDTDGWPGGGGVGDRTHLAQTSYRYANNSSINANEVPFFVLPLPRTWPAKFGIKLGDLAAVVFKNRLAFATFADFGPSTKLGEGSIELHRRLGVERLRNGRIIDSGMGPGVITIVFPGSRLTSAPMDQRSLLNHIETNGGLLFQRIGGNRPS